MRFAFFGDVVGRAGRDGLADHLPGLRRRLGLEFVIVNAENAAAGFGITESTARELFEAGADALTLGNHSWDQKEALTYIVREPRLIRPLNYSAFSDAPGRGAQMIRAAGSWGQLMAKEDKYAQIRMPSGEVRMVLLECRATIGQLGNIEHEIVRIGKAGRSRWLGIRPTVRGVVMNPVDHPHGGGEGKAGQGNPHPVSPWGMPTKGYRTRKNKRTQKFIVRRRGSK